jgi:NADP-dependent aldehyde dehydrogenase
MITGKNYIGNQLKATGSTTFKTINPKLNIHNEWESTEATEDEIKEATQLAWDAFKVFRNVSDQKRADFLNACADNIEALGDELISTYCTESGLPEGRAQGERGRTCFQLRSFAEMLTKGNWNDATIEEAIPDRQPMPKSDIRKTYIPLGPVVVFGSSNFPLAYSTAGGDTAAAFAALLQL